MRENVFDLIVIGGGASGFYGAIRTAEMKPGSKILILEKTTKLLSKVRVSGGGRCNVTHDEPNPFRLADHYPRGEKQLRNMFKHFNAVDVVKWFESKGVQLKTEEDGRMFPVTDDSETIIECFLSEASRLGIAIQTSKTVKEISSDENGFQISCLDESDFFTKKILVASGGNANGDSYSFIRRLGHKINEPIPSLFTFNDPERTLSDLMGLSVKNAEVRINKTKFLSQGPLLITHWGLSGPAVIRLSAWAAAYLHEQRYTFDVSINWTGSLQEDKIRGTLASHREKHGKQKIISKPLFEIPQRLWQRLNEFAEIPENKIWSELPQRNLNKLIENLIRCQVAIRGKTTFKEEFVTCGGVDLSEVNSETLESRKIKNLFFAGEVLHIDGETGGFNFQAAWTTANLAAKSIAGVS
jgi:predicted Rossmann fold flavoprotein